jgi:putative ABC transport system ATP-binding protein
MRAESLEPDQAATAGDRTGELVIEATRLVKTYDDEVQVRALRSVDLGVRRGSFVAIMGPSGSGKSTLLNILAGLEPATSGRLVIEGIEIGSLSEHDRTLLRRRRIGFVFQQFNLLPIFNALENVAVPLMLSHVGLQERVHQLPSKLSGGEQQRVAIARALVTRPAIVLADEPTGSLDSANGKRIIDLLREIVDDLGQTVVMVTHDASVAERADRTVGMRDGQIDNDRLNEQLPSARTPQADREP